MAPSNSAPVEAAIRVASGRLVWTRDGDDLVAGKYRIRPIGPGKWETMRSGRFLRLDSRRSTALAMAEHHHRDFQRTQQITRWGLSAGAGLLAAVALSYRMTTLMGFLLFMVAVGAFLSSLARCVAAINRNLLDPYRTRESWEPPDWWNH